MTRVFPYLLALFLFPQVIFAEIHYVPYNVRTILNLMEGDTISLTGFPIDWIYSRVVLGINSSPSLQMSGNLIVDNHKYGLNSYYQEIDLPYSNSISITYKGQTQQRMPFQWWVDNHDVTSSYEKELLPRSDSLWQKIYNYADSLYEEKTKHYIDLGAINNETIFESTSHMFKITDLPFWKYTRLYVQVEPLDGRELNGYAYAGNKKAKVSGWTSSIILSQKSKYPPFFELVFPEYRKIKIKWWATNEQPPENLIQATTINLGNDSIQVNYKFGRTPYSSNSVKLKFDKNAFTNGLVPVIKKLSFNPHGPENIGEFAIMGDIFDIQAQLKSGKEITLALPLDFVYVAGRDSVTVGHFIESENHWIEEPVDSIVDGYAYFKANSFSLRSLFRKTCKVVDAIAVVSITPAIGVAAIFSKNIREEIESTASKWTDIQTGIINGTIDGVYWIYDLYNELKCFDFDGVRDRFTRLFVPSKSDDWRDPEQGTISNISRGGDVFIKSLKSIREKSLITKQNAIAYCTSLPEDRCNRQVYAWQKTSENLDVLLADVILRMSNLKDEKGKAIPSRFTFSNENGKLTFEDARNPHMGKINFTDYFLTNSGMISDAAWIVRGLEECYNATNLTGTILTNWIDWAQSIKNLDYQDFCKNIVYLYGHNEGYLNDIVECSEFALNWNSVRHFFESHSEKLIEISNAMTKISLLTWIDKSNFREYAVDAYKSVYDGTRAWLELAGPMFLENNIVAKAHASLALYEFIYYGTHENLDYLNSALKRHYGENGGYSEGTGYSQYIWDDVPYILSALQDAYKSANKPMPTIDNKFLLSPYYMIEFSRPIKNLGYIPIEIDDGCTYNPDYRVWAKLTGDANFVYWSKRYPLKEIDGKIKPILAFGIPDESIYVASPSNLPEKDSPWGAFKDGIGVINVKVNNEDTISLSIIAEKGSQWTNGQNHDQQDNLSITLSSSKKGFIIQDRGYSGFNARKVGDDFHRHANHNVLTRAANCDKNDSNKSCNDFCAQRSNRTINVDEIRKRAENFTGKIPGVFWSLLSFFTVNLHLLGDDFKVEGGTEADFLDSLENKENELKGYSMTHHLTKCGDNDDSSIVINHRTILYFGKNFWVIDRPNEQGMAWLANSPKPNWSETGLRLYGSSENDLGASVAAQHRDIPQNSKRSDYPEGNLKNYWYAIQDKNAITYVMNYPVNNESFVKTTSLCPSGFQCFENSSKNKRLIVPPLGRRFHANSVLDKFSGYPELDGIMLATKNDKGIWEYNVLDGKHYGTFKEIYTNDLPALRILLK